MVKNVEKTECEGVNENEKNKKEMYILHLQG